MTVLLNTGFSGAWFLESAQKYPSHSNWKVSPFETFFSDGSSIALLIIFREFGFKTDDKLSSSPRSGFGSRHNLSYSLTSDCIACFALTQ